MFLSKKLVTNIPVIVYEKTAGNSGTIMDKLVLAPGFYDIVCIGGGAGAAAAVGRSSTQSVRYWADGGVGGTVRAQVFVHKYTEIDIAVGAGSMSRAGTFSSSGASFVGVPGIASSVSGIENFSVWSYGGLGGRITTSGALSATATAGAMGTTSVSGTAIKRVLINNTKDVVGSAGSVPSGSTSKPLTWTNNLNWEKDPSKGAGASVQYINSQYLAQVGRGGYVRITKL